MKKTDLINFVNNQLGYTKLKTDNTVYSNINRATPCWWLNISPSKFNSSLNIILIEKDELQFKTSEVYLVTMLKFHTEEITILIAQTLFKESIITNLWLIISAYTLGVSS